MATYQFSALSDGQAISFNYNTDVLNFNESTIAAADIRVTASGANTRIEVIAGASAGKDILLLNTTPFHVTTSNIAFADGSRLYFGDNSTGTANDNGANARFGGAGRDQLNGFGGNDTLNGGGGADDYRFSVAPGAANADTVGGFVSGTDHIVLDSSAHANLGASGEFAAGDARFRSGAGVNAGQDADDRVIYNTTTGQLWYDADGNGSGAAQLIATLQGAPSLVAGDIAADSSAGGGGGGGGGTNGTPGNDSLTGTSGNDSINGLGGHDTVSGVQGNDVLTGGDGNDSLLGGPGSDSLLGGAGNDTLHTDGWDDGSPSDNDVDTLDGGLGDDLYVLDRNVIPQGSDTAVISDAGGVDTVLAHSGSWTLSAGLENLTMGHAFQSDGATMGSGNELNNVITGFAGWWVNNHLQGLGGHDTILGGDGEDLLEGDDGNDSLTGGDGNDTLMGGAGNDVLNAGGGGQFGQPNQLTGGLGNDSFLFSAVGIGDEIGDFASGVDKLRLDANAMTALGTSGNFAAGDERFHAGASAAEADDRVIWNASTRQLWYDADGSGSGGAALIALLQAGAVLVATDIAVDNGTASGGSTISGTAGNDSLTGTAGNDTLDGLGGADTMNGQLGDDTYHVTAGDVLQDSGGIDTVLTPISWNLSSSTSIENVTVTGTASANVDGNALGNVIIGNDANNTVNARAGSDTITGNGGNDYFLMSMGGTTSFGTDWIDGGAGIDTVDYGANARSALVVDLAAGTVTGGEVGGGSATILNIEKFIAGGFADRVSGNSANNNLYGGLGNDTLLGLGGVDSLTGADGNDWLEGGTGFDTLSGGTGNDSFVFNAAAGSANADRVTDFAPGPDQLLFENDVFTGLGAAGNWAAGDGRFRAAPGATAGADGNDRLVYNTSTGSLYYDADGAGGAAAQIVATLAPNLALSAADITVI